MKIVKTEIVFPDVKRKFVFQKKQGSLKEEKSLSCSFAQKSHR